MYRTCNSMNNLLSYCGSVDAKIRASDKDLPVAAIVVVVLLVALHLQIGYGIVGFVTHSPPLQSASFEQNCPSSHVEGSAVVVAIVVVVILVVLHLQRLSHKFSSHSPPLQSASL